MAGVLSPVRHQGCELSRMATFRRTATERKGRRGTVPTAAPECSLAVAKVIKGRQRTHRCGTHSGIVGVKGPELFPCACLQVPAKPFGDALSFRILILCSQPVEHFIRAIQFPAGLTFSTSETQDVVRRNEIVRPAGN